MGREELPSSPCNDDELSKMIPNPASRTSLTLDIPQRWISPEIFTNGSRNASTSAQNPPTKKSNSAILLWNEDFSHRPSWCDAGLALTQIKRGKARGNKFALYLRWLLQRLLFSLGCFIQKHCGCMLIVGLMILGLFSLGLQYTKIEINIDKLWVENGGRLEAEKQFIERSFAKSNTEENLDHQEKQKDHNFHHQDHKSAGVTNSAQYSVLIHTSNVKGGNVLNQDDLLLHAQVLSNISQMTVEMFGEKWSLTDICFKPDAPTIEGEMAGLFQNLVDKIIPCVMITPLDCFFEGSIALGPFPPAEIPDALVWVLPSLKQRVSWKTLDPIAVVDDLLDTFQLTEIETLKSLFHRAGVENGYLKRPCIDPLNKDCPETAPNYVNLCPKVVHNFIIWNNEQRRFNLTPEFSTVDYVKRAKAKRHVVDIDNNGNSSRNSDLIIDHHHTDRHDPMWFLTKNNTLVKVLDVFGVLKTKEEEAEKLSTNNNHREKHDFFEKSSDDDSESDENCRKFESSIREILRNDARLRSKFLPDVKTLGHQELGSLVTGGCSGFAQKFMHWPEDLIIGGIEREGRKIVKAEALQTVLMINSAQELYQRVKSGGHKNAVANRFTWTLKSAEQILDAWQRNFTNFVYNHRNNSQSSSSVKNRQRQLHPLAGTSVNDMMAEFSKFNPTVILVGYLIMIGYAALSFISLRRRGVDCSVTLAVAGCLLVTASVAAGLGCSMIVGIAFNAATTQIVPFLALGLGVNDMFLLMHNFASIVRMAERHEIGLLLKETGLSALLTSLNNIVAYSAGTILCVPALRDFCLQVTILLTFNMIAILTVFPAMLTIDLHRRKRHLLDIFCCFKMKLKDRQLLKPSLSAASSTEDDSNNGENENRTANKSVAADVSGGLTIESSTIVDQKNRRRSSTLNNNNNNSKNGRVSKLSSVYHHFSDSGYSLSNCSCCCAKDSPILDQKEARCGQVLDKNGQIITTTHTDLDKLVFDADKTPNFDDDIELQHSGDSSVACSRFFVNFTLQRFVERFYARWMARTCVKVFVSLIKICLLSFGVIGLNHIKLGLELTDVLPKNTPPYAFLDARQAYFSFYPFNIILKGPFDIANNQQMIRKFHDSIKEIPYIVKSDQNLHQATTGGGDHLLLTNPSVSQTGSSSQFWLQLMSEWLTDLQSKFDADFEAGLINRHGLVQNRSESVSPEAILAYKLLCNHGDEISRSRVGNTRLVDKDGIVNPEGFYNYLTAWYYADQMTYYVSQANLLPIPPFWQSDDNLRQNNIKIPPAPIPVYSQIPYFLNKLVDTPSIIDMIIKVRGVCDEYANSGLDVFPDGIPFTFWEQYLHLKRNLLIALSVVIGAVFLVNTLLLMSVWMATLVVVILISMEIELAGFMGIVGLKLNAVSGVSLITAVGICVESTVHVALCFLTSLGSRNRRMTSTLEHVTVPVFHGGLSTLLGVVMLAFSEFEFVFRYFFMVLSALIVLGIFNGLCVFPILLSMFGPKSEVRPVDGSDHLDPPTPPASPPRHQKRHSSYVAVGGDQRRRCTAAAGGGSCPAMVERTSAAVRQPPTQQQTSVNRNGYHRHSDSLSTIVEEPAACRSVSPPGGNFVKVEGPKLIFYPGSTGAQMVNSPINVTNNTNVNLRVQLPDADAILKKYTKLASTLDLCHPKSTVVAAAAAAASSSKNVDYSESQHLIANDDDESSALKKLQKSSSSSAASKKSATTENVVVIKTSKKKEQQQQEDDDDGDFSSDDDDGGVSSPNLSTKTVIYKGLDNPTKVCV